jgi:hypothetical protein
MTTANQIRHQTKRSDLITSQDVIKFIESYIIDAKNAGEFCVNPAVKNKSHTTEVVNHFVDKGFIVNKRSIGLYDRVIIGWRDAI